MIFSRNGAASGFVKKNFPSIFRGQIDFQKQVISLPTELPNSLRFPRIRVHLAKPIVIHFGLMQEWDTAAISLRKNVNANYGLMNKEDERRFPSGGQFEFALAIGAGRLIYLLIVPSTVVMANDFKVRNGTSFGLHFTHHGRCQPANRGIGNAAGE